MSLTIVSGPMFAGKTTWLIEALKSLPPESYQVFKPQLDTRYSETECVTHDGKHEPALSLNQDTPNFSQLPPTVQTILIDELNFFSAETLWPELEKLLKQGKNIIGVGLLYDFQKQPFGATLPLSKMADTHVQLTAHCDLCGGEAEHSYRKVHNDQQILLGASESYGACCQKCWEKLQE